MTIFEFNDYESLLDPVSDRRALRGLWVWVWKWAWEHRRLETTITERRIFFRLRFRHFSHTIFACHFFFCSELKKKLSRVNEIRNKLTDHSSTSQHANSFVFVCSFSYFFSRIFCPYHSIIKDTERVASASYFLKRRFKTSRNRVDEANPFAWVPDRATAKARLNAVRSNKVSTLPFDDDTPRPNPSQNSFLWCTFLLTDKPPRNLETPTATAGQRILDYWISSSCILQYERTRLKYCVSTLVCYF